MHISIFQRVHFGNLYAVCLAFIGPKVEEEMRGLVSGRWALKFMLRLASMLILNETVLDLPPHC